MGASEWVKRGPGRSHRKLLELLALGIAALLLVAGILVFLQMRANDRVATDARVPVVVPRATAPHVPRDQVTKPGGTLPRAARKVAADFLLTAVARERLAVAWELATPELRGGVTRQQWLAGALPVPPFPISDLEATGFKVNASAPDKILLQVFLVPKPDSGLPPTRYDINLVRSSSSGPWRVDYCQPYAPLGKYSATE